MHYTRNNTCIHANHIREYQSQLWNNFQAPEHFKMPYLKKPWDVKRFIGSYWRQRCISEEGDIR